MAWKITRQSLSCGGSSTAASQVLLLAVTTQDSPIFARTPCREGEVCFCNGWLHSSCLCSKKGFKPPRTWQVILVIREVTDARKVPGQVKRRPLKSHGSILSLDLLGGNAEGTEGGNSDSLHVEEKGRAEV